MNTGENAEALRKIIDFIRKVSLLILFLHFYVYCYRAFEQWGLTHKVVRQVLERIGNTGLFASYHVSKIGALFLVLVSLIGSKGKKDEKLKIATALRYFIVGLLIYGLSHLLLGLQASVQVLASMYMAVTGIGFLMILHGGSLLSRIIRNRLNTDVFNKLQETFPQEERLLENEFSINLPAQYNLKGKIRKSWINFINPFRALLVVGTPGAGKSYFVIRHVITQHIAKGFSMFVYDFKFDDLSIIAYNAYLKNKHRYKVEPKFYVIDFDSIYHRCNPLYPESMTDITDATESSRTIMLGLNREWIKKAGDFFVESPINFLTGIIWYLRKFKNGKYCTLPHCIELMQMPYDQLFPVLRTEPEIEVLINPFVTAYINGAMEQLEGQIASAKITMARLASPQLYYVLTGNDFTLDINNPEDPKIVCVGNNPQKTQVYGAVLSLYVARMLKLVNQKDKLKSSLLFDEFPTIYIGGVSGIEGTIATARGNKVATTLAVQDISQLRKDYGKESADVIFNIVGNLISGQVLGDTAKTLSERFGKIMQERESLSINASDTSISKSTQLESAIPASTISSLSSGEFVGSVADNPEQKIQLKNFHCEIINDHAAIKTEMDGYVPIPKPRTVTPTEIEQNYLQIKEDIVMLIESEMERIYETPELAHLLIVRE
ncbi:conjugal transfer protein MobC [Sphingobacterium sp. UME9]|uniref:conjugal transfer protein MobC n=1 Tax=Sphingobacterium TaxID=28453 RepID=UPI001603E728|nr:conjugal transfer protein MobC [Sphingobacterium sp. UME9]MBB1642714.1 conjugal transfer protein TraG [Sphingobacterium sp. UME9]